ncbi:MAG: IS110 family transposase [Ignavibacteriaceae bacterium]
MFLKELEKYKEEMSVGVESTHNYYWLFDNCLKTSIPFYLGHAYYLRAIRGKKNKNDKKDSKTLGDLMRSEFFPIGYPYPAKRRAVRDLLRRRCKFVQLRAGLYRHIDLIHSQQGLINIKIGEIKSKNQRRELIKNFCDEEIKLSIETDLNIVDTLDKEINTVEKRIRKVVKTNEEEYFKILLSFPGIGEIIALTIIYEIDKIDRFITPQKFSSYSRVVKPQRESSGKKTDDKNKKIGNPYLKWSFGQAALYARINSLVIRKFYENLVKTNGKTKANSIMRHKIAVSVYYMLKNKELFNEQKFLQGNMNSQRPI